MDRNIVATRRMLVPQPRGREELPPSHLDRAILVKGVLDTDGDLRIDGAVEGIVQAQRLIVGFGGSIDGDVIAADVLINGRVNGRIFAFNVKLEAQADITGRVFHHHVTVEKGARIDGRMPWRPLNYFEAFDHPTESKS